MKNITLNSPILPIPKPHVVTSSVFFSTQKTHCWSNNKLAKIKLMKPILLTLALTGLMLSGCGGGGGESNNAGGNPGNGVILEGVFSDSPVEGLGYQSNTTEGKTNNAGKFHYAAGEKITFYIGEGDSKVILGTTEAKALITPMDLLPQDGKTIHEDFAGNIASLLQTLDEDENPENGIVLSQPINNMVVEAMANQTALDFNQSYETFTNNELLSRLLDILQRKIVAIQLALAHVSKNYHQSRSSTITISSDNRYLLVVNRQNDSVSVIEVRDAHGNDIEKHIAEIPVGKEPRYVAIGADDAYAYVSNTVDGTVSVIDMSTYEVAYTIPVGTEPRGIAITPNGRYAYVANHTEGSISVISTQHHTVINTVKTGGNPLAVAISNDGDKQDRDERIFVTRFFSELINEARPDGFNDAKQGIVDVFNVQDSLEGNTKVTQLKIAPTDSGFSADRRQFCIKTRQTLQDNGEQIFFNSGVDGSGDGATQLANEAFCPDVNSHDASEQGPIGKNPQLVYPNQLYATIIRGAQLYIPNVAASPEPPVKFNTNIQSLIGIVNRVTGADRSINLNSQIAREIQPANPTSSLDRIFANDIVAIDANKKGTEFLIVSRGGNYVLRAKANKEGQLDINADKGVTRFKTGNLPSGVVMSSDGKRAYTNNEVNTSVTSIDLINNVVINQDINSSEPPAPGSKKHRNIAGKLAFFTALGIPDVLDKDADGHFDIALRDINPLAFRGKASDNGWSSCASCHEDGHSDNVTWIFPTGPRQTIALEGTFARGDLTDQRILNWNGVRGSVTDFNNNSRGVQGGIGHATNVNGVDKTAEVFNHGVTEGVSDALDAMTEWVANAVRSPIMPAPGDEAALHAGASVFKHNCASCHGGVKWTKSRTSPVYQNNPTFTGNPLAANFFAQGREPALDARLTVGGPQIIKVTDPVAGTLNFLDKVGTFDTTNVLEIRGAGALGGGFISIPGDPNEGLEVAKQSTQGFASLGGAGFNTPSLLGVGYHAPYFHDGSAATLEAVYQKHTLPDADTATQDLSIEQTLSQAELKDLTTFLQSIDDDTPTLRSDADDFIEAQNVMP